MNRKSIYIGLLATALCGGFTSCEDYLEKSPESTVSEKDAYKNFNNFQGFVEQIYARIPDKMSCNWCPSWNWGDDELFNPEANSRMTHQVDLGNFFAWTTTGNWLYKNWDNSNWRFSQSLYPNSWKCIRIANMGLEQLEKDEIFTGTQEEKDLLMGQLYFFRAWWHFELSCYLGGLPYVDKVLDEKENNLSRLSFADCANRCAEDFRRAADLLPINWDNTVAGSATKGNNDLRINKIMALGYLGKAYLWAGSPLATNGAQTGGTHTYDYNADYCKKAADAFGELLDLVENGATQYELAKFEYDDIYNHKNSGSLGEWSSIFYTISSGGRLPGAKEAIFRNPTYENDFNYSNWNNSKVWGPKNEKIVEHDNVIHQPTANYVEFYGMKNGLPLDDPESGFDPTHPWKNRDPRFYHDIVFDGFKYINGNMNNKNQEYLRYCSLYTGGEMRNEAISSTTGYFIQKLVPHTCNAVDGDYNWGPNLQTHLCYMRLADIYLMYAEACAAIDGATGKSDKCSLTALDAINKIRMRCGAGEVSEKYSSDKNKFMDEIRRERAVELSFEGYRFCDLQRWLLLTEPPYNKKYKVQFDRVVDGKKLEIPQGVTDKVAIAAEMDKFYRTRKDDGSFTEGLHDPKDAEVANYRLEEILTRDFLPKHYWFPFPINQTYFSADFPQNPGW
jgi:hypothetical protein